MKKIILLLALMLVIVYTKAQIVRVYDKTTLQPLPYIQVVSNNKEVAVTNLKGEADISKMKCINEFFEY